MATANGNGAHYGRSSSSSEDEGAHIGDAFCQECFGMGRSRLERRDVPGFREIIVRAFECEECGHRAEEVNLAGQCEAEGVRLTLAVPQGCAATLGRQLLKSDTATISVPELEFEIGAAANVPFTGDLATVSGVLLQACRNLNMNQAERRQDDPGTASKIDEFILELESYAEGRHAFTLVVEDDAGNSFVAGPDAGSPANDAVGDPQLTVERYRRTAAQDARMGLDTRPESQQEELASGQEGAGQAQAARGLPGPGRLILRVEGEAEAAAFVGRYAAEGGAQRAQQPPGVQLFAVCAACGDEEGAGFSAALLPPVPAFIPRSLIMHCRCATCGTAAAEVRGTGSAAARGVRLRLRVEAAADLERAVLRSATASAAVPELELALSGSGGGGAATTVGELIRGLAQQLGSSPAMASGGAAGAEAERAEWGEFVAALRACSALERPWTLELTDPLGDSWVAPAGPGPDDRLSLAHYDRSAEEEAHLRL